MAKGKGPIPQHKVLAETGSAPGNPAPRGSTRFAEGGFVKTGAIAQTRGAARGYAHRTGKHKD